jgi:tetratricopeptide (TPR) repeat protein
MSVYRRMIGRELPCSVLNLLEIAVRPLGAARHEELAGAAQLGQADADAVHRLGRSHLARQEWGLARQRLLEAVLARPGFVAARLALAGVCDLLCQHEEAAAHIDAVLTVMLEQEAPAADRWSRYALLCAAGLCLERDGRWQEARGRYLLAQASQPMDQFALHRLVAIDLGHGEHRQAIRRLREVLGNQPQDQTARICLGHLLQMTGKRGSAIWEYEQALCLQPESWELPLEVSSELQTMGNSDAAIGILEKLIGAQPHFPDLRMRLGNMYSRRGEDELARAEYAKALELHPEYLDCHIAMARHELRAGRAEAAVPHFRWAIAINNQNVEACAGLAAALHGSGRQKRAGEMLKSAGRIANNSAVLMAQLAALEAEDAWAEGTLAAGLELDAELLRQQAARDAALLAAHPGWNDLRVQRAMLLRLLGQTEDAVEALRQAMAEDPADAGAHLQLGLALAQAPDQKPAAQTVRQALAPDAYRMKLSYELALICCGDLAFDLTMETVEQLETAAEDVQRRIWTIVEEMQLTGLHRAIDQTARTGIGVRDSSES